MNDELKASLIEQFSAYLEDVQGGLEPAPAFDQGMDQFSLVAELASLKTEHKHQSRQTKDAVDQFKHVLGALQSGYETLNLAMERRRDDIQVLQREALRPLLLQLLELHDRLEAGVNFGIKPPSRRSLFGRWHRQEDPTALIDSLRQGQKMTLRRLQRIFSDYDLRPLDALGEPHDQHTMRVVEVEQRADVAQGVVTAELRKGFFWGDDLLRPAEVKVNKHDTMTVEKTQ